MYEFWRTCLSKDFDMGKLSLGTVACAIKVLPVIFANITCVAGVNREGERKRERGIKILSIWVLKKLERFQVLGERRGGVDIRFHGPNQLIIPKQFYCRLPGG